MAVSWKRRRYSKEQFTEAWTTSTSIRQVAVKLNCNLTGGGHTSLRDAARDLGLSSDHMTGQGWNSGREYRPIVPARSLESILVEDISVGSNYLKQRLFKEGLKAKQCETCGITEWMGNPAPLALDHVDGNKRNNLLENLMILCYNCHGLTSTYAGKNIGKKLLESP